MKLQSYKELEVWKRSMSLVRAVYTMTKELPAYERYGLCSQIQRAAVSIPSNIAEGYARKGTGEYIRFLSMAYGSAAELDTQLLIIEHEYKEVDVREAYELLNEVQKMLYSLMEKLKS